MGNRVCIVHEELERIPWIEKHVVSVDLRRNRISKMSLNESESVRYLDLSDNKIVEISDLENVPNLRILDLSYNLITEMILPCMNVEELYLISNDITRIGKLHLPKIKKLDIAVNNIDKIENLDGCSTLEELYLGGNKIREVDGLRCLLNLKILDLQSNEIETIDCCSIPRGVERLLLGGNRGLRRINGIERLESLKTLGIEKTSVQRDTVRGNFVVWD